MSRWPDSEGVRALFEEDVASSRGAHALFHWLCGERLEQGDDRVALLNRRGLSDATIDRLVDGTLTPGEELAQDLAGLTGGAVLPEDWEVTPGLAWETLPRART